jgi:hypothetical protein
MAHCHFDTIEFLSMFNEKTVNPVHNLKLHKSWTRVEIFFFIYICGFSIKPQFSPNSINTNISNFIVRNNFLSCVMPFVCYASLAKRKSKHSAIFQRRKKHTRKHKIESFVMRTTYMFYSVHHYFLEFLNYLFFINIDFT